MLTFEIPYASDNSTWYLDGLKEGRKNFESRLKAVSFAMSMAKRYREKNETVCIRIEGADGHWRKFNADMLPTK